MLGAVLIVFGLYAVLWGKAKEVRKAAHMHELKEPNIVTGVGAIDGETQHSSLEVVGDN